MRKISAFTLVELLVVVTVIVVLLSLLMPAMSRAVYQAELVRCAANQKVVAMASVSYATEQKRWYPNRPLPAGDPSVVIAPINLLSPTQAGYDLRPMLRDKLQLNVDRNTQCPFVEPVELDRQAQPGEFLYGNQALWMGWNYRTGGANLPGMQKLGGRFEWNRRSYNLLVSDYDLNRWANVQGSHPDKLTRMRNWRAVNEVVPGKNGTLTLSLWISDQGNPMRGPVDMNFAYDDVSVRRVNDVTYPADDRMDRVPNAYDNRENLYYQVPRQ